MIKAQKYLFSIFSVLLILVSVLPLQAIAETLQPTETKITKVQVVDAKGQSISQEIEPDANLALVFDLTVAENATATFSLPVEITVADQELYRKDGLVLSIADRQLTVVNENSEAISLKDQKIAFTLAVNQRDQAQVKLHFFDEYAWSVQLKQAKTLETSAEPTTSTTTSETKDTEQATDQSAQAKERQQVQPAATTPRSDPDNPNKTAAIEDMALNNIYIKSGSETKYVVKDGVVQNPQPTVKVGDGVYFDYTFTVDSSVELKDGNFIYIALPDEYFTFSSVSNSVPFTDNNNVAIGQMTLETIDNHKFLKITFNSDVETNWNGLTDCYARAYGIASKDGEDSQVGDSITGSYPIDIQPKPGDSGGYKGEPIGDQKPITKNGGATPNSNEVYWNIPIMMDNYKKAFEGDTTPELYHKVVLKDQLDPSLTLESYRMYMNLYAADENGKMTSDNIGFVQFLSSDNSATTMPLKKLIQNSDETDSDFENRIENATEPSFGVTKGNLLVMNFKDVPNITNDKQNGPLLYGNGEKSAKERIFETIENLVTSGKLSAARAEKTKEAYERCFSHDNDATYDNFPFSFVTRITCSTTLGEGSIIENKATVYWETNTSGSESGASKVTVSDWGGATRVPPTTFRLKKLDKDTNAILQNVEFELQKKDSKTGKYETIPNGKKSTGTTGVLLYENLTDGEYRLVEIKNPNPGYTSKLTVDPPDIYNEEGKYYFTINSQDPQGVAVVAYNELAKGKLTLEKTDQDTGALLDGAKFTLRNQKGEEVVSDALLETGKNYLYQYNLTSKEYELMLDTTNPGEKGKITVSGLPLGEYYFQEEQAPTGYTFEDDGKSTMANLTADGAQVTVQRVNRKEVGKLHLVKTNDTGENLSGAEFELYALAADQSSSNFDVTFTTGKNYEYSYNPTTKKYGFIESTGTAGELLISGLPLGEYYLIETKAPPGYEIAGDGRTTSKQITADGVTIEFTVLNERAEGAVTLQKVDATNERNLQGAKFKVATDMAGTTWFAPEELAVGDGSTFAGTYQAVKTGNTWSFQLQNVVTPVGELVITGMPAGSYYFVETQAPTGYVKGLKPVAFTITPGQEAQANVVTVTNQPKGTLPKTGGNGPGVVVACGIISLVLVLGYFMKEGMKREKAGDGR